MNVHTRTLSTPKFYDIHGMNQHLKCCIYIYFSVVGVMMTFGSIHGKEKTTTKNNKKKKGSFDESSERNLNKND